MRLLLMLTASPSLRRSDADAHILHVRTIFMAKETRHIGRRSTLRAWDEKQATNYVHAVRWRVRVLLSWPCTCTICESGAKLSVCCAGRHAATVLLGHLARDTVVNNHPKISPTWNKINGRQNSFSTLLLQ